MHEALKQYEWEMLNKNVELLRQISFQQNLRCNTKTYEH